MGTQSRSTLVSTIVIGLVLQATCASARKEYKSRYYIAIIDKSESKGKCSQDIIISGHGVHETFKEHCVDDLKVISNDELLVIGNPKTDPFSYLCFGDTPNVMVTVKKGKCMMKIYTTTGSETIPVKSLEVAETAIKDDVCKQLQMRVDKMMQENKSGDNKDGEEEQTGGNNNHAVSKKYEVISKSFMRNGKCIQEINVEGNGVVDFFRSPCVDNLQIIKENILIIGDPEKDPFCLFSDKPKTLVTIKDGICKERTYRTENELTTSSSADLSDDDCKKVQSQIKELLPKKDKAVEGHGSLSNKFSVTTQTFEKRGKCFQDVKVEGNGVEDHFRGPCADDFQVVNNKDALVAGNPSNTPFTLFSNKDNTLVIFKDGSCEERTYKTDKGTTSSSAKELDEDKCNKIEEKVKAILDKNKKTNKEDKEEESQYVITVDTSERRGRCIQKVNVTGNGIDDNFRGPCVKDLEILKKKNLMIVGNPEKDPFSLFSNKANKLVTYKDGICKERTYKSVNGEIKSTSSVLEDGECDKIVEKIKKTLENKGNSEQDDDEEARDKYEVTTETSQRRGKCILIVNIKGNGVEEVYRGVCVNGLQIAKKNVLIVGDPSKDPFSLFSDKANKLVIFKDELCMEKTYKTENGKTKSTTKELKDDECDKIVEKIEKELEKEKNTDKGGDKKLSKFEVNKSTSTKKGRCIQEVKVEGNGVEDIFKGPCKDEMDVINENGILIVGNPIVNEYGLYTDKANSLITVKDGICTEKIYTIEDGKIKITSSKLEYDHCEDIENKIQDEFLKREQ